MGEGDRNERRHEPNAPSIRAVVWFAIGIAATVVIVMAVAAAVRPFLRPEPERPREPVSLVEVDALPPRPRLQRSPPADLRELRAREDTTLASYGWVDRESETIRIPIERAMALVVHESLPVREDTP